MARASRAPTCGGSAQNAGRTSARRALQGGGVGREPSTGQRVEALSRGEIGPNLFDTARPRTVHVGLPPASSRVQDRPPHPRRWRIAMPLAPTLQKHLDQNVTYEVITHDPTMSSTRTAQACHVSGDRLAKAIVLRRDGGYMLAVLPASHHIRLPELRQHIRDHVALADASEIKRLFPDCALGPVPAICECYALDVVVHDSIQEQPPLHL